MALIVDDRVRETTDVIGTGAATLLGPVTGHQAFAVIGNSNTTYYCIADQVGSNWEVGIGTYASAGNTITRTTVLESSNANALVSFTAGVKDVFVTYPASKSVYKDASNQVTLASQLNLTNASNYNLYASGAGANYMAGSLGVGITPYTGVDFVVAKSVTGGTTRVAASIEGVVQSDVTSLYIGQNVTLKTAAATFTCASVQLYRAFQSTLGVNSSVTTQLGFLADATLTGATSNNYGFVGSIPSGTGRYNLYMGGTADNYLAGSLGIGTATPSTWGKFAVVGASSGGQVVASIANTSGTANTQAVLSFDTTNNGFNVRDSQIRATNNGANQTTLEFYTANGTTPAERMRIDASGNVGIGATPIVYQTLTVSKNLTGFTSTRGIVSSGQIQSDSTAGSAYFVATSSTQATTFNTTYLELYSASQGTFGVNSTVTNQYGFAAGASLTGATNNYGFYGNIPSGSNRYNLYMPGTAANYLAGDLQLAKTVTAAGATGAQTINKTTGTVNFAAGATSLVVTNSLVTANSIIIATVGSNDTAMKSVAVVAGAGSFTLYANAAAAAETRVNFLITN